MKTKKKFFLAILGIVLIFALGMIFLIKVPETSVTITDNNTQTYFHSNDTIGLRNLSYNACSARINTTINSTGVVLFEECGKNCLGGCPNSGPEYCFYGIRDDKTSCLFYLKSRIYAAGDKRFISTEVTYNHFKIGENVRLNGTISVYSNYYCGQGEITPECSYLVID